MRYLFGFLCVLALGVMPVVGCSESGSGGMAGSGGQGRTTCFQDDECNGSLICCHVGSPFTPGTCETQAACDELQGGTGGTCGMGSFEAQEGGQ